MAGLAALRAEVAAAVSAIDGVTVSAYPTPGVLEPDAGWVTVRDRAPSGFAGDLAVEVVVAVCCGHDLATSEVRADDLTPALLAVAADLICRGVVVRPETWPAPTPTGALYVLTLTMTIPLEA